MYNPSKPCTTSLRVNQAYEGETIEQKIRRIVNNKEPITDGAPLIYTDRKEGVGPQYDIRTDRFEIAIDAMDKVSKAYVARREERARVAEGEKKDSGAESVPKGLAEGSTGTTQRYAT